MPEEIKEEEEKYVLTPECILYETLKDWGIKVPEWNEKVFFGIYSDFMSGLQKAGYAQYVGEEDNGVS